MQTCDTRPPPPPKKTVMVFRAPRGSCISCSGWLVPCHIKTFDGSLGAVLWGATRQPELGPPMMRLQETTDAAVFVSGCYCSADTVTVQ